MTIGKERIMPKFETPSGKGFGGSSNGVVTKEIMPFTQGHRGIPLKIDPNTVPMAPYWQKQVPAAKY